MRRKAFFSTIMVMAAASVVAAGVWLAINVAPPLNWSIQQAYSIVNLTGLVLASLTVLMSTRRPELRRYLPGFSLIALVMAARMFGLVYPVPVRAHALLGLGTLPIGLTGGAMVIWEWQRVRTEGTKTR